MMSGVFMIRLYLFTIYNFLFTIVCSTSKSIKYSYSSLAEISKIIIKSGVYSSIILAS